MATQLDASKGRDIVARWCNLAERRLEYLTELFDSGRWRRFYDEQEFLENVREAKSAVQTWRDILSREASRDNRPIDLSWIGRRTALPRNELRRDPAPLSQITDIPILPPQEIMSILAADDEALNEPRPTKPLSEDAFTAVLDRATIAARYPALRNTL